VASLTVLTSFTRTPAAHGALEVRPIPGYGAHLGRYPTPTPAHGALVFRPLPGYGVPWAGSPAAHGALVVRPLPGYRATLAGTMAGLGTQEPCISPSLQSTPSSPVTQI